MSKDKDRALKQGAIRLAISKRWFPQLEVAISSPRSVSNTDKLITDIDVLALAPDELTSFRMVFVDCKTKKGESPISRTLWLRGLMDHLHADRGICVLKRNAIERDHRHAAGKLGIMLLTESELPLYSRAMGVSKLDEVGSVGNLDTWDKYFSIPDKYPALCPLVQFSRSTFWTARTASQRCRKTIAKIVGSSSELDPAKSLHVALVFDMAALLMVAITCLVNEIFLSELVPSTEADLSNALLLRLYGGRDNYAFYNDLRKMIVKERDNPAPSGPLAPPEFGRFLQLIRQALESPNESSRSPLILRELAFSMLSDSPPSAFATTLAGESPQGAKLALMGGEYLCNAGKLPPEFRSHITNTLMAIQPAG